MRRYHVNDIWFISDHHLGDKGMITRSTTSGILFRDFKTTDDMDEHIIARHNSVVAPNAKVYFLGDLARGKSGGARIAALVDRMHGRKRLILGNHDEHDVRFYRTMFEKVLAHRQFTERDAALVCTHYPLHPNTFGGRYGVNTLNVHGHMHTGDLRDPRYFNVCAERVDYTPMHYDWLIEKARMLGTPRRSDVMKGARV